MKKVLMSLTTAILTFVIAGPLAAQMHGGTGQHMMGPGQHGYHSGQHMMGPGMRDNLGTMSGMMGDMHQMLHSGQLTPEQQRQMLEMMNQMGGIMQQMGGPQGTQMEAQHRQQLQQLQKQLRDMKRGIQR